MVRHVKWLGLSSGLLLGTKHSALLIVVPIIGGCVLYIIYCAAKRRLWTRTATLLAMSAVFAGIILWGIYGFRYTESGTVAQQFNRPLELKISDLQSHNSRAVLTFLSAVFTWRRVRTFGAWQTLCAPVSKDGAVGHTFSGASMKRARYGVGSTGPRSDKNSGSESRRSRWPEAFCCC